MHFILGLTDLVVAVLRCLMCLQVLEVLDELCGLLCRRLLALRETQVTRWPISIFNYSDLVCVFWTRFQFRVKVLEASRHGSCWVQLFHCHSACTSLAKTVFSFHFRGNFIDRNHGLLCNDFACESSVVPTVAHRKARTCLPDGDDDKCAASTAITFRWPVGRWAFLCLCSTHQGSESDGECVCVCVWAASIMSCALLCLVVPCDLLSKASFLAITGQVLSLQQCLGCFVKQGNWRPKMYNGRRKCINYRQSIL